MPLDPRAAEAVDPNLRGAAQLGELDRRVRALERAAQAPALPTVAGTPTTTPRAGTPIVDTTAVRLWIRVNGVWRYATLT